MTTIDAIKPAKSDEVNKVKTPNPISIELEEHILKPSKIISLEILLNTTSEKPPRRIEDIVSIERFLEVMIEVCLLIKHQIRNIIA